MNQYVQETTNIVKICLMFEHTYII